LGITSFAAAADSGPGRYVAEASCGAENISGPDIAHGGWVAGVLDEVVGLGCVEVLGRPAVTCRLEVRFRRPTPANRPLRVEATVEDPADGRIRGSGTLVLAETGDVLAMADGEWTARRPGRAP
jgi:acyl-coenzyme A thioesterase PaaI-like protein